MDSVDRFKLLHGPYRAPRFRYGATVADELLGAVRIVGLSAAPIPWPIGSRPNVRSRRSLVLYGALARAVRLESNLAVAHHWGVSGQTVTKWRKALGVATTNAGTSKLRSRHFKTDWGRAAQAKAVAKAQDPARRAKIAAARKGKPRPVELMKRLHAGNVGRNAGAETRRKMAESHRRLGTRPPAAGKAWTAAEDRLLATLRTIEVAQRTGRTLKAVSLRRRKLGMQDGRRHD